MRLGVLSMMPDPNNMEIKKVSRLTHLIKAQLNE